MPKPPLPAFGIQNKTAYNEREKLTATFLNTVASASVVLGVLTPLAAFAYGTVQVNVPAWLVLIYGGAFATFGLLLHFHARNRLRRLRE